MSFPGSPYNNLTSPPNIKFHEGWLEHKGSDGKWIRYWCVLRDNIFYFFKIERDGRPQQIGTLTLNEKSKLDYKGGDVKSGFKFEIHSQRKVSYMKVSKSCEREIWRAYVDGIAKGRISDTIDLLPGQIREVQDKLGRYFSHIRTMTTAIPRRPPSPLADPDGGSDSAISTHSGGSIGLDSPNNSDSGSFPLGQLPSSPDYYLTPVSPEVAAASDESMNLVFYPGAARGECPTWYFHGCTRQLAEQVLTAGATFGNTLMRSKPESELDLVISKRLENVGPTQFSHYLIKCQPNGYKMDVADPHEPMGSLTEVMNFFVRTSGRQRTHPMTCNDLSQMGLGQDTHNPYNTAIIQDASHRLPGNKRYPHTTREAPSRRQHIPVMSLPFPPSGSPGVQPSELPPPPPPLNAEEELFLARDVPLPPPPTLSPPPPPAPHITLKQQIQQQQHSRAPGHGYTRDRSKSAPNISADMVAQIQSYHQEQVKKHNVPSDKLAMDRKKLQNKRSHSVDVEDIPPPLPPNHPTAGRKGVADVNKSLKAVPSSPGATTEINSPTSPAAKAVSESGHVTREAEADKPIKSTVQEQATSELNELAAVTARIVKKAPEVAPKPTKEQTSAAGEEVKSPTGQQPLPVQSMATASFKQRLDNIIATPTSPSSSSRPAATTSDTTDHYENIGQYQNVGAVGALKQ